MDKYRNLMDEVEAINKAFGYFGALDALAYIRAHEDEYEGIVLREFDAFCREGARMFAPVKTNKQMESV